MRLYVGITDGDWYESLAARPNLEEVNFWQPSGGPHFKALEPGGLFLFKRHASATVGGAFAPRRAERRWLDPRSRAAFGSSFGRYARDRVANLALRRGYQ